MIVNGSLLLLSLNEGGLRARLGTFLEYLNSAVCFRVLVAVCHLDVIALRTSDALLLIIICVIKMRCRFLITSVVIEHLIFIFERGRFCGHEGRHVRFNKHARVGSRCTIEAFGEVRSRRLDGSRSHH